MVAPILAPLISSLIANGLGTLANALINKGQEVVEEKLGVKIEPLLATEEGRWKLAQLEMENQEMLLEMALEDRKVDLQFYEAEVQDRDSARKANSVIATSENSSWLNKNLVPLISIGTLSTCLYGLIWTAADTEIKFALLSIITMILAYYYGSSSLAWKQQGALGRIGEAGAQK